MRNSKKLIAVIMTVALLASMMVPALASTNLEADKLAAVGLMKGNGTDLDLASNLTRAQGAILAVRAKGAEAAALAMTSGAVALVMANVNDAATIPTWAYNYAAYAIQNGIINGTKINADLTITFSPSLPLSGKQFIIMMLRSLGYTGVTLDNCVEKALAAGMLTPTKVVAYAMEDQLIRDDAASIIYSTVNNGLVALSGGVTPSAIKLVAQLVADNAISATAAAANFTFTAPPAATAAPLMVVSATATNLKEIVVAFDQALDSTKVLVANFTIGGANAEAVALAADGKTVTVQVPEAAADAAANGIDYALVVTTGVGVAADVAKTVRAIDTAIPTVTSLTLTGPTTFDVTFSEPVNALGTVLVNSGIYGASITAAAPYGNTITVTLASALAAGNYTINLTGFKDYAEFNMDETILTLAYVKNLTPASIMLEADPTQTVVKVTFNKEISTALTVNHFYHTFSAWVPNTATTTDHKTYTLTFTTFPIPAGPFSLVVKATDGITTVTDVWGVSLPANVTLAGAVTADLTKPTVALKEVVSESSIKVTYSEAVLGATTAANYVVKKADGTVVAGATAVLDVDNTYTINLGPTFAGGAYTLTVSNVTDNALAPNTILATVIPFTITDLTPPTITAVDWAAGAGTADETVYVTFNEAVAVTGLNSALELNNYRINTTGGAKPTAAVMFGTSGSKVKLTFADVAVTHLVIGQVADIALNKIAALSSPVAAVPVAAIVTGDITSITTKSLNTIEIVINKVIPTLAAAAFTIKEGAGGDEVAAPAMISYTNDGTVTTVIATLTSTTAMTTADDKPDNVDFIAGGLVSDIGATNALFTKAGAVIVDGIKPSITTIAQTAPNAITVTFDEAINALGGAASAAQDLVITMNDGTTTTTLIPAIDYVTTIVGSTVVIAPVTPLVNAYTYSVKTKDTIVYIVDASAPVTLKANPKTAVTEIVADVAGPVATVSTTNATTLVLTYNEALYTGGVAIADAASVKALFTYNGTAGNYTSATYNATAKTVTFVFTAGEDAKTLTAGAITDAVGNAKSAASDVATYTLATTTWALN